MGTLLGVHPIVPWLQGFDTSQVVQDFWTINSTSWGEWTVFDWYIFWGLFGHTKSQVFNLYV